MNYRRCMVLTYCREGALFVKPPHGDKLLSLAGTGRRIWEYLEYPVTVEEIARKLACEFAGDIKKIVEDTGRFLTSLQERELVETRSDAPSPEERQRFRYLWLLKRALVNLIYPEHELRMRFLEKQDAGMSDLDRRRYLRDIRYREPDLHQALITSKQVTGKASKKAYFSHTIIGLLALDNIERCAEIVFAEDIPGDFLEAGVCQGGAAVFMRAIQTVYGDKHRRLWAADSFEGLPLPKSQFDLDSGIDFSEPLFPELAFSLEGVRDHFIRYDLLDPGVVFLPGWFADTLPTAPIEQLAILRLDADMYASTLDALEYLYPKVTPGGFVIVDDYGYYAVCRQAVEEYRTKQNIDEPLQFVNWSCVYWRKRR